MKKLIFCLIGLLIIVFGYDTPRFGRNSYDSSVRIKDTLKVDIIAPDDSGKTTFIDDVTLDSTLTVTGKTTISIVDSAGLTPDTDADDFVVKNDTSDAGISIIAGKGTGDNSCLFFGSPSGVKRGRVIYQHNGDIMYFITSESARMKISSSQCSVYVATQIGGDLTVAGAVKPAVVYWDLMQDAASNLTVASGSNGTIQGGFQGATADSIITDSLCILWATSHNDVYMDTMNVQPGFTRAGVDATPVYENGTNVGAGSTAYVLSSYVFTATFSKDWRIRIQFWTATSGTAGSVYLYSAKLYGHYK